MKDYTEIAVILDRSGSMQARRKDHEGGLKSFVEDQKGLDGDVRFTLIQFDTQEPCEVVYDGVTLDKVKAIELIPRGGTPLLDAVGKGLAHVEKRIGEAKPHQIVVLVITDGEENESREWSKDQVAERVKELEEKGWHFLFLAANIDAFAEARSMGMAAGTTSGFANNNAGTQAAYAAASASVFSNRAITQDVLAEVTQDAAWERGTADSNRNLINERLSYDWTDSQRKSMMAPDEPPAHIAPKKPRNLRPRSTTKGGK